MSPPSPSIRPMPSAATWPSAARLEWESLGRESDPTLYLEGLLGLAGREEAAGRLEVAMEVYTAVLQAADAPGADPNQILRNRAQERLDAILGRGAFGPRAEFLLRSFTQQASDPVAIFAMGTAGAVFRMTRLATLSRLAATSNPGFMTQLLGAGRVASLAGFALEAPAFVLAGRLGGAALGRPQEWSGSALGGDLASSFLVLGGLRLAGWAAASVHRGLAPAVGAGHVQPLRRLFQQGGMFSGILLGHALETHFGLRPSPDGATTLLDSLALLLQFNIAGRLTRQAFGRRFAAWERGLDLRAESLSAGWGSGRIPPTAGPNLGFGRPWRMAEIGPRVALGPRGEGPMPAKPELLFMVGRGGGGNSWQQDLQAATELRLQLSPEGAWRRRGELTADYVAKLKELPRGRREVLEETQRGLDLIGAWAVGRDSFRQAIGFRHYAELWNLLAGSWTHLSLNAAMTDAFRDHIDRHRDLLAGTRNVRFLAAAIQATPQLARVYTHTQGALVEGSPRERDLTESLAAVTRLLREGATAGPLALRRGYLEAFHDTLNNSADFGGLPLAREALAGIRLTRRWLTETDPEFAVLGRNYFPRFWEALAARARPQFKESMLGELQEEIVFLQQNARPYRTPRDVLLAALRAFPFYSETVFQSVDSEPGTTFALLQTFLNQASHLRPWILEHSDSEVRATAASAYLRLMTQLQAHATEIQEFEGHFPASATTQVTQELVAAVDVFAQRWKTPDAEQLLPALRDYQELATLLPERSDLVPDLLSESNLKPLMNLQYHPDPRVRPASEELLVKLFAKFSGRGAGGGPSN